MGYIFKIASSDFAGDYEKAQQALRNARDFFLEAEQVALLTVEAEQKTRQQWKPDKQDEKGRDAEPNMLLGRNNPLHRGDTQTQTLAR